MVYFTQNAKKSHQLSSGIPRDFLTLGGMSGRQHLSRQLSHHCLSSVGWRGRMQPLRLGGENQERSDFMGKLEEMILCP